MILFSLGVTRYFLLQVFAGLILRSLYANFQLALLNLVPGHYLKDVLHYLYFDDLTSLRQTSSYFRDFIRDNKKTLIKSKREQKVDVKWLVHLCSS